MEVRLGRVLKNARIGGPLSEVNPETIAHFETWLRPGPTTYRNGRDACRSIEFLRERTSGQAEEPSRDGSQPTFRGFSETYRDRELIAPYLHLLREVSVAAQLDPWVFNLWREVWLS
jgi:hypothetical protein